MSDTEQTINTDSILDTAKKLLGIMPEYTAFDADITTYINSVFMTLRQLGVGPENGYEIKDKNNLWTEFVQEGNLLNAVKSYMYLKVRALFDPPTSSVAVESMNRIAEQFEWRITILAEESRSES